MFLFILFLQFLGCFSVDPRAVHVNHETSSVFRPRDVQKHNLVVNNVKALIRTLEKHFNAEKPVYRKNLEGELTHFFFTLGEKFVKQSDNYIRNFTNILMNVIEDYHFRNQFTPIFGDDIATEAYVVNNSLNKWHLLSVEDIRNNVQYALDTEDTIFHRVIQFADTFFNESDRIPLADIARDLYGENEERKDVEKVIRGAINFIFVKKYKGLSNETKIILQDGILKLLYGYNMLEEFNRDANSDVKINVDKSEVTELITTEKEEKHKENRRVLQDEVKTDITGVKKDIITDKVAVLEVMKEISQDLERIKRKHMKEIKKEKSEEKIKKEGEVLLGQVEKEIKKLNSS